MSKNNKRPNMRHDGFDPYFDSKINGNSNEHYRDPSPLVQTTDSGDIARKSNHDYRDDDRMSPDTDFNSFDEKPKHEIIKSNFYSPQHQRQSATSNTENFSGEQVWMYAITSHGKQLASFDDARRYIFGLAKIWKIDETSLDAQRFLTSVQNAVKDKKKDYSTEFIHESETNIAYATVKVQHIKNDKCAIYHCLQTLQRRSSAQGLPSSQVFACMPDITFFKDRADKSIATHSGVVASASPSLGYTNDPYSDGKIVASSGTLSAGFCGQQ